VQECGTSRLNGTGVNRIALAWRDVVRIPTLTLLGFSALFALGCRAAETAPGPAQESRRAEPDYAVVGATPCKPSGEIRFVCDLISPEDLAVLPGAEWVITSGNREGGRLHLVSVRNKTATVLFPTSSRNERFDATTYPTCPGPLQLKTPDAFRAHGLYLKPGQNAVHTLYVVHHGPRESIEVFEVDARGTSPSLTWIGCAPALSIHNFNSVVALPEGGFAATNGGTNDVWQYHTDTGWRRVPGSEGTAPNGLEISKDGRWLYIAGWAEEKLTRLSRAEPIQKDVVKLGFRPDNVRMSSDGSVIFAAGHTDKNGRSISGPREPLKETSNVARIDPQTLEVRRIFQHPAMDGFVASTTAIQIGNEMWLGSQRGERVAYFPAPK
jgi:hypothetical protein